MSTFKTTLSNYQVSKSYNDENYWEKEHNIQGIQKDDTTENHISIQMDIPKELSRLICEESERAAKQEIAKLVKNYMTKEKWTYYSSDTDRTLQDWVKDMVKEELYSSREEIVKMAAHELAMSMAKSKTVRERFGDILDGLFSEEDDRK